MTGSIASFDVSQCLTAAGHTDAVYRSSWTPGYRAQQDSQRTVYVWHDGPDEQQHLDQYAQTLRDAGYAVTLVRPVDERLCLCIRRL
ncbi:MULTISPECIES: hypothetical protein [unclassified Streptomyces]|uniref:hypothetical protein n=1 Tax=unclassified Streptomyces TaxID=2593676 RepID=UPI003661C274